MAANPPKNSTLKTKPPAKKTATPALRKRAKPKAPKAPSLRRTQRINRAANTAPLPSRESIRPQKGPQETFLSTPADIAIYGGAAGGGKTWAALYEPLRHKQNATFEAVLFRRTRPQIMQAGGLWVESSKLYPRLRAKPNGSRLYWTFPSGSRIRFAQLQHEKSKFEWMGSQITLAIFDELTHFSEGQFFYIVSRMRSTCGVRPYIRATCNPDANSWVAEFISWWIDPESGLPIPERSGVIRYFVRDGNTIVWGDSVAQLREKFAHWEPAQFKPKSVTFIAATVHDNQALLKADPDYLSNLMSLPLVEREQLLGGNWKIKAAAGLVFKEAWFEVVGAVPTGGKSVTGWDFAGSKETKANKDPDFTANVKVTRSRDGVFFIERAKKDRESELGVQNWIVNQATQDGRACIISFPKDPAQAGKFQTAIFMRRLAGYDARPTREEGTKEERARYASAQAEAGNIKIVCPLDANGHPDKGHRDYWDYKAFLSELAQFPDGPHDDLVDAFSRALNTLAEMFM